MSSKIYPIARYDDIVVQQLNNETLVYDLKTNNAFCLNETSALVWQECDGKKDISEISRILTCKLAAPVAENLVYLALDGLKKENLLKEITEYNSPLAGISRREAIKRAGLASIVALPAIASIVAPTAAMASSTCGAAAVCTTPANCPVAGSTCVNGCCVDPDPAGPPITGQCTIGNPPVCTFF